jgi:membrane-associated phospholipid phosphatase
MTWLHSIDVAGFRFINQTLGNPFFDWLMPILSGNRFFVPAVLLVFGWMLTRKSPRARVCAVAIATVVALGDGLVCNTIKEAVERPRPFLDLSDAVVRIGKGGSGSMPSAHAANWAATAMVVFLYYRRSWRFMAPLAFAVGFSRIYNGVHYPSDVLAGWILGAGYPVAFVIGANWLWNTAGRNWMPEAWRRMPSLLNPEAGDKSAATPAKSKSDVDWLRFGYLLIAVLFVVRLVYQASNKIDLTEDEAYQWVWSKHPALSYFSKPLMIAMTQLAGTTLWGDTEFGVRFFAPVIAAILSVLVLRFMAREAGAKAGFFLVLILTATPLTAVGATLMTIDPLSVLFWTAAMIVGWRAVQEKGTTAQWIWVGVWSGCGLLSKYTNLLQLIAWPIIFAYWPQARRHLRRPGPWLALGVIALATLPVIIWNQQHDWITAKHVAEGGGLDKGFSLTLKYFFEWIGAEWALLNPVFSVGAVWAAVAAMGALKRDPLRMFLFAMGAPILILYLPLSFHSRIQPNWIAPAVVPWFCLMVVYWTRRRADSPKLVRRALAGGLAFGLPLVVLLHDTNIMSKIAGRPLPAKVDPLRRTRGWEEMAQVVGPEWRALRERSPGAFIIGDHYGTTGLLSFYLPEAAKDPKNDPQVFYMAIDHPQNQFFFFKSYLDKKGQSALFVGQEELGQQPAGWLGRWLRGEVVGEPPLQPFPGVPEVVRDQFAEVVDLGVREVRYRGRLMRGVHLYECRGLK